MKTAQVEEKKWKKLCVDMVDEQRFIATLF